MERVFALCYTLHGGSGLTFGYESILSMPIHEIEWYVRKLDETRTEEANNHRKAQPAAAKKRWR